MDLFRQRRFYWIGILSWFFRTLVAALVYFSSTLSCFALTIGNTSQNIFSGRPSNILVKITKADANGDRLLWRLAANNRTLASGRIPLKHRNPQEPLLLRIDLPELSADVILETTLTAKIQKDSDNSVIAELTEVFLIYAPNPLIGQKKWIQDTNINLYDPAGHTSKVFMQLGLPFRQVNRLEDISNIHKGILIIGENNSLQRHRSAINFLIQASSNGLPVLFLPSADVKIPVTQSNDNFSYRLKRISFETHDILKNFSPKSNLPAWPGNDMIAEEKIGLTSLRTGKCVAVQNQATGWSWVEFEFFDTHAKFIYTSTPLIEHWESSPVPRYLLLEIIKYMSVRNPT